MTLLSERVYQTLRDYILQGHFRGGDRLREEELASLTNASRTPIREALRRLDAEGLVSYVPNRGAEVVLWGPEDLAEVYALRFILEPFGARMAAQQISDDELAVLDSLLRDMESVLATNAKDTDREFADLNYRFHRMVTEGSGLRRLRDLLDRVVQVPLLHQTLPKYGAAGLRLSLNEHKELVAALRTRDPDWAEALMSAHILGARHRFNGSVQEGRPKLS